MVICHPYLSSTVRNVLICGGFFLAFAHCARADGGYIPEKAIRKLPEIPEQRALVAFRDGKETLIVESALEGQGRNFGWIIPVPARPDSIEASTPGTLKSLASGIQPEIVHDISDEAKGFTVLCLLVLFLTIVLARGGCSLFFGFLLIIILGLLVAPEMAGKLGSEGSAIKTGSVMVMEKAKVGSYAISVLAADDAEALYRWLEAEDLAVPDALRPAVNDYTRRGWKFVTAKLTTNGIDLTLPHPLRITFPSNEAVYPMKLTGLSGRKLNLELYVVADQAAEVSGLKREFCDQFKAMDSYAKSRNNVIGSSGSEFEGWNSQLSLGHPGFLPVLWDGCWISKLTGRISSAAMANDYVIAWKAPSFERWTLYSHRGAAYIALSVAIAIFAVTGIFAEIAWRLKEWPTRRRKKVIRVGLIAAATVFCGIELCLPQTEVVTYKRRYELFDSAPNSLGNEINRLRNIGTDGMDMRKSAENFLQQMSNAFTGEPVCEEDTPGNYTIVDKDGQLAFTFYGLGGTTVTVEIPAD
jgi:hypothetical protein